MNLLAHFNAVLLLSFLIITYFLYLKFSRPKKLNLPPSPQKLPIIGNLHLLGSLPHRSFQALSKKYGPLMMLHLGQALTLVVSSAEIAEEIMKTQDITFASRPKLSAACVFFDDCHDVGFAPYGEYWRQVRKICVVELLSAQRVQSFSFIRKDETTKLMEKLRRRACVDGSSVNLTEMLLGIASNIVSRAVVGQNYDGDDVSVKFGKVGRTVMELLGAFSFKDFYPSLGWMDALTGFSAKLSDTSRELNILLDQIIQEHHVVSDISDEQSCQKSFLDIFHHLQRNDMPRFGLTRENIKAILMDMFIGGTDTTSTIMEWSMAELVKSPSTMKKVQEEIRRVVGNKSIVDEEDIIHMDYLKCIVKETLRLHPPVALCLPRETQAHAKLGDYDVPANTRVYINIWAIQRDPNVWDRPEEFIPDRFIGNPVDHKGQHFQFIPFGAGRRGCPGMMFGLTSIEYVVANLLYMFNWELPHGELEKDLDMNETFGLTLCKKTPLYLVPLLQYP